MCLRHRFSIIHAICDNSRVQWHFQPYTERRFRMGLGKPTTEGETTETCDDQIS